MGILSGVVGCVVYYKILGILLVLFSFSTNVSADFTLSLPSLPQQSTEPELFIFVSFSMPEKSLKLWAGEANRVGGKLLLRGFFDNSLKKTTAKTMAVFGQEADVDMAIDPERFQKFNIQVVPAVVIVQPEQDLEGKNLPPLFDVVYGDTSLEAALQCIEQSGSLEGQKFAKHFLKRYRGFHE